MFNSTFSVFTCMSLFTKHKINNIKLFDLEKFNTKLMDFTESNCEFYSKIFSRISNVLRNLSANSHIAVKEDKRNYI
jgi:hypothetical protein